MGPLDPPATRLHDAVPEARSRAATHRARATSPRRSLPTATATRRPAYSPSASSSSRAATSALQRLSPPPRAGPPQHEHPTEDGHRVLAREGRLPAEALVEHAAEREDVGARVDVARAPRLLGRHVRGGTEDRAGRRLRPRAGAGDAEVDQLDA